MRELPFDLRFTLGEHASPPGPRLAAQGQRVPLRGQARRGSTSGSQRRRDRRACSCSATRTSRGSASSAACCSSTAARSASPRTAIRAARSRSCAAGADGVDVTIERVEYDAQAVADEVAAVGLPSEFADKLAARGMTAPLAAPPARRVPRLGVPRRAGDRVGHRGREPLRRPRPPAARERRGDRGRAVRDHPDVRRDQRRALQPRRLARRRRTSAASPGATRRAYVPTQIAGCVTGAVAANAMFELAAVSISETHRASGAHLFAEAIATVGLLLVIFASFARLVAARAGGRRRLHRRRLLVHQLDELREPGDQRRPHVQRHVRRHRARVGAELRRSRSSQAEQSPQC